MQTVLKKKFLLGGIFGLVAALFLTVITQLSSAPPKPTAPTEYTLPPSRYSTKDFYFEGNILVCHTAQVEVGIDVSHHQETVDWQAVADSGISFAFIRLGYRGQSEGLLHTDRLVAENLAGAKAAGLKIGAYFYSQAISVEEAEAEAAYALEILGDTPLDLPLVFDWEQEKRNSGMEPTLVSRCAIAFCTAVEAAGYESMIYFNPYQAKNLMDMQMLEEYDWWLAMYDVNSEIPCRMDFWQYTNEGSVPGIRGKVDINLMFPKV